VHQHNYYVYIVTNPAKTVLYVGVTNDLDVRIAEHYSNRGKPETFAGKYYCYNLLYQEHYSDIKTAINREKEIKGWTRKKKMDLIKIENPSFKILNEKFLDRWPPEITND
jgi:putative endonuclease